MGIEVILRQESPGWKLHWGDSPITTKIVTGILDYHSWRYKTWGVDMKCLTLLKRVRLVWNGRSFLPSIIFLSARKGYEIMAYLKRKLGILHTLNTLLEQSGVDSNGGEKCSTQESGS